MNKTDKLKKAYFLKRHEIAIERKDHKMAEYFWNRARELEDDRFIMGRDNN
jgi:hypothetical protein